MKRLPTLLMISALVAGLAGCATTTPKPMKIESLSVVNETGAAINDVRVIVPERNLQVRLANIPAGREVSWEFPVEDYKGAVFIVHYQDGRGFNDPRVDPKTLDLPEQREEPVNVRIRILPMSQLDIQFERFSEFQMRTRR